MRTIISGLVNASHIADAELFAGIVPTGFVTNGETNPPAGSNLSTLAIPICKKVGVLGEHARNYTLCQSADAAIIVGQNEHLSRVAAQYGLSVYQA